MLPRSILAPILTVDMALTVGAALASSCAFVGLFYYAQSMPNGMETGKYWQTAVESESEGKLGFYFTKR